MRRLLQRTLVVVLTLTFFLPAAVSSQTGGTSSPGDIQTGADNARRKIHKDLVEELESSPPNREIWFAGHAASGVNLDNYTDRWFARPDLGFGVVGIVGYATPAEIIKIASDNAVYQLQLPKTIVDLPKPADSDVPGILNANIEPQIDLQPGPGPAPEGWYHTGAAIHGSQQAWDKGFTGQDVIYMSNDSGADYCHPDLFGTWAYVTDNSSPYYGLPMMFDSYSMFLLANDIYLGSNFVASGATDYADTSATASGLSFSYSPLGASSNHTYRTTGTSRSGTYHYGSHPDNTLAANADILSDFFGNSAAVAGERAGVLVVDENTPGVYDTVYVDLNFNFDFRDDTPARLPRNFANQEAACLDYDNDGLNDVSGGLVYFIADGVNAVPASNWYYSLPAFGPGDLVAFHVMDSLGSPGGNHGMGTTSVATGQGVVSGSTIAGPSGPPQANGKGLVVGPGRDVRSTQNGDFYSSAFVEDATVFGVFGYDGVPLTGDEVQIISNSWGSSDVDNDGWDEQSQLIDFINREFGDYTTQLFSTGNGAAGYGTTSPPSPSSAISVGASTLYGSIGQFESIASEDQIVGGDPMSWSNRGPGAVPGQTGVDVVATGAFGTGDVPLNEVLDGSIATGQFGGTSMAAPVAAGNLALIFDAWFQRTGMWPTFEEAKALLMGSSKNTDHDVWTQGAGLVNADNGTDIAYGNGGAWVMPTEWAVGDYQGYESPAFGQIIAPGGSETQAFTFQSAGGLTDSIGIEPVHLTRIGSTDYSFTSNPQYQDHGDFTTPDYAWRIDQNIPNDADMIMVRVTIPYDEFDPNDDLSEPFNNWRVHFQNWTDLDHDGRFWVDANHNGKVDLGEMDANEHIRFTYGYDMGPTQQARMADPLDRIDDGLLLTFRHRDKITSVRMTHLKVEVSYWQWTPWDWVDVGGSGRGGAPYRQITVPGGGTANLTATLSVPNGTPFGMYEGALMINGDVNMEMIPISVAVAAQDTEFDFGGNPPADTLYDNGNMFGYTDYSWRAESGDWRFYWADIGSEDLQLPRSVPNFPAGGVPYLMVDNQWSGAGTDIDTLIYGPFEGEFNPDPLFGPYTLERVGGSPNLYQGSGRWGYDTSSGGPREIVAAPIEEGLQGIFLHQVKVDGNSFDEPIHGSVGMAKVAPGVVEGTGRSGSEMISFYSELGFEGLTASGYGVSAPMTSTETIFQDDPNDPSTASFSRTVSIQNGAELTVKTCCTAAGSDIDLYVYGPDGGLLASSTTATDEEFVTIRFPADGTYTIEVHGWAVTGGSDTFELTVDAVQGSDISASVQPGPVAPGSVKTVTISWNLAGRPAGVYRGVVLLGPPNAPGLISVPVEITVSGGSSR